MLLKLVFLSCCIALVAAAAIEQNSESDKINHEHEKTTKVKDDEVIELDIKNPLEKCDPGKRYRLDCNTCFCSETGFLGCTMMGCPSDIIKPIQYPELPEGPCEIGKTYQKDCNTCLCGDDGVPKCGEALCSTKPNE